MLIAYVIEGAGFCSLVFRGICYMYRNLSQELAVPPLLLMVVICFVFSFFCKKQKKSVFFFAQKQKKANWNQLFWLNYILQTR